MDVPHSLSTPMAHPSRNVPKTNKLATSPCPPVPSLRYKKVQALKNENPPVWEISIDKDIRITLQEFDDHIYLRNIGGHKILP